MAAGAVGALLRRAAQTLLEAAQRHFVVRAQIDSRDDAYWWVMHWLAHRPGAASSRHVSVASSLTDLAGECTGHERGEDAEAGWEDEDAITMLPAPGEHVAAFRGRALWVSRRVVSTGAQYERPIESLHLTLLARSLEVVRALVEDARKLYFAAQHAQTAVYANEHGRWALAAWVRRRPLDSVVLPTGMVARVLADASDFLAARAWYARLGVPYRRGYLLHGPPGTGKTSAVKAVAGALRLPIYLLTLDGVSDESARSLLASARARCVVLVEDVDAAFGACRKGHGTLTFSGLLNALDGVAAQEGRLLFMTTNHVSRLDAALIRPGRVDMRVEFAPCTPQQARALFERFYADLPCDAAAAAGAGGAAATQAAHSWCGTSDALNAMAAEFAALYKTHLPVAAVSPAALQGFLMRHKRRPDAALAAATRFLSEGEGNCAEGAQSNVCSDAQASSQVNVAASAPSLAPKG